MFSTIFIILIIIIVLFFTIFLISKYERTHFKSIKLYIKNDKIDIDNYSFIFFSDLHEKSFGNNNKKLLNYIKNTNIKNIFIGGDLITFSKRNNNKNICYIDNTLSLINNLNKDYNIYYAFGNHELRLKYKQEDNENLKKSYHSLINFLYNNNIHILDNKFLDITNNIRLYGISVNNKYYKKKFKTNKYSLNTDTIKEYIDDLDKNKYNICLLHNPDFAEKFIDFGFDMILSGHHHGGMIRLPFIGSLVSPDFKLLPKYSKGLYYYKNKPIIVNGGLGEHSFNIRLNNICELYNITISK